MATQDEFIRPFSESINAMNAALGQLRLSDRQRRCLRDTISIVIRKCADLVTPEVSVAAAEVATRRGLDLRTADWHDQGRFDPGRLIFHYEHVIPVSVIRQKCETAASADEVAEHLRANLRVAWILKDEDRRLTSLGYRSRRTDPDEAYREAGIVLERTGT